MKNSTVEIPFPQTDLHIRNGNLEIKKVFVETEDEAGNNDATELINFNDEKENEKQPEIMNTVAKTILIILICLVCLGTLFLGVVFIMGSGFIFAGDIDLTDEQRKIADINAGIGSVFGVILVLLSLFVMLLSAGISERLIKLFSAQTDE